jgi:hypothetical protein
MISPIRPNSPITHPSDPTNPTDDPIRPTTQTKINTTNSHALPANDLACHRDRYISTRREIKLSRDSASLFQIVR